MVDGVDDEPVSVAVLQSVEDAGALLPGRDEPGQTQFRQVLGDRGGGLVDDFGEVIHGEFVVAQRQNQADPGRIGEHPEDLDGEFDILVVRLDGRSLSICIHTQIIAWELNGRAVAGYYPPPATFGGSGGQESRPR